MPQFVSKMHCDCLDQPQNFPHKAFTIIVSNLVSLILVYRRSEKRGIIRRSVRFPTELDQYGLVFIIGYHSRMVLFDAFLDLMSRNHNYTGNSSNYMGSLESEAKKSLRLKKSISELISFLYRWCTHPKAPTYYYFFDIPQSRFWIPLRSNADIILNFSISTSQIRSYWDFGTPDRHQ